MAKKRSEIVTLGDEQLEVTEPEAGTPLEIVELEAPAITSPVWHDFVMTKFDESEVDNSGYPRVSGLRRVTEMLLGDIRVSEAYPISDHQDRCSVKFTVELHDAKAGTDKVYSDVADATRTNVGDNAIGEHLLAVASTRAEARVLRKLLRLRVLSSEEASLVKNPDGSAKDVSNLTGFIEPAQIQYLEVMCKRNNIDLWKYVNSGSGKYSSIEKIPYKNAQDMLRYLTKVQTGKAEVDETHKGFDVKWRENVKGGIA